MEAYARAVYSTPQPKPLPPLPWALEPLWIAFQKLSRRRQAGMAVNALTQTDIELYAERRGFDIWETDLLCRLDDAAIGAMRAEQVVKSHRTRDNPAPIHVSNVGALKAMFRGLAAKKEAQFKAKGEEGPSLGVTKKPQK